MTDLTVGASRVPSDGPLVVFLEDDPTGTQLTADVPVVFDVSEGTLRAAADDGTTSIHVMLNSRSRSGEDAHDLVAAAATAVHAALPEARIVLRGDSTLRGHVLAEFEGLRDGLGAGRGVPLVLVPALPSAGRVTLGGVHYIKGDDGLTPLHETAYAKDAVFGYSTARLADWADERSGTVFDPANAKEVSLSELRGAGASAVVEAIRDAASLNVPAVVVVDAETDHDLALRCSPGLVPPLGRTAAARLMTIPDARTALLVCGSYVPSSSLQLKRLLSIHPRSLVEVDIEALIGERGEEELARTVEAVLETLRHERLAVLATPRAIVSALTTPLASQRISRAVAQVVHRLPDLPDLVIAKGGITSHVTAEVGLGAKTARVLGQLVPGVVVWDVLTDRRTHADYAVVPGNVGGEDLLLEVTAAALPDLVPSIR